MADNYNLISLIVFIVAKSSFNSRRSNLSIIDSNSRFNNSASFKDVLNLISSKSNLEVDL